MLKLSVAYPVVLGIIERFLYQTEQAFRRYQTSNDEESSFDFVRAMTEQQARICEAVAAIQQPTKKHRELSSKTRKRGAVLKLTSALTMHHKYSDGSVLNLEPIGNNQLAQLAGVSKSSASLFFRNKFNGYAYYKMQCADNRTLISALKLLNDEFTPQMFNLSTFGPQADEN